MLGITVAGAVPCLTTQPATLGSGSLGNMTDATEPASGTKTQSAAGSRKACSAYVNHHLAKETPVSNLSLVNAKSFSCRAALTALSMLFQIDNASAGDHYDRRVLLINNSSYAIKEFYASNVDRGVWDHDILGLDVLPLVILYL